MENKRPRKGKNFKVYDFEPSVFFISVLPAPLEILL